MTKNEFMETVKDATLAILREKDETIDAIISNVTKTNGVAYSGLSFRGENNIQPVVYLDSFFALGIEHTTRALNAQSAVDEMTNEMFKRNAETLKQGAIDAAIASERGIVDIEILRKVNADIITSINEVVKIHEEGSKRRAEATEELGKIEDELKQAQDN